MESNNSNNSIPTLKMDDLLLSIKDFFRYLATKIKFAIIVTLICVSLAMIYFIIQPHKYQATTTFILEEKSNGLGSGLSGLASQFGVDIGSLSGNSSLFAGDNILDILRSQTIIEKVLLSRIDSIQERSHSQTLIDLYLDVLKQRKKWSDNSELSHISFDNYVIGGKNSRLQDSVLFLFYKKLTKKNVNVDRLNKKGSIIEVTTVSANEIFSKLFTERLVAETMKMYVEIKTSVASRNIRRLQQRSDSLSALLSDKSYKSASVQLLDANVAYKSSAVPAEVSQREKSVTYALYTEVMKNLEASQMALANQTPVINILDNSMYPLEDKSFSFIELLAIGVVAGIVITFVFSFTTYVPKS